MEQLRFSKTIKIQIKLKLYLIKKTTQLEKDLMKRLKFVMENIFLLYSDDFYEKDKLMFQYNLIENLSNNYGLVYGPGNFFNDKGQKK